MKDSQFLKNLPEVGAEDFLFRAYGSARRQVTVLKGLMIFNVVLLGVVAFFEAWMWTPLGGFSSFVTGRGVYYLCNIAVMIWVLLLVFKYPHRMLTGPMGKYHIPEHLQRAYGAYCEMLKFPHIRGARFSFDKKGAVRA